MTPYKDIFLIDDDDDDREFFMTALDELSETVTCTAFNNATVALQALRNVIPDAIFIDWNMPVMNGEDFLIKVKIEKELAHIPVIVISTTSHQDAIAYTKSLGATDFIIKPNRYQDLVMRLKPFIT